MTNQSSCLPHTAKQTYDLSRSFSRRALEFVLNIWLDNQEAFFAYDSKVW